MRNTGNASLNYEEMSCAKMKSIKTLCGKKNNRKVVGAWSDCQRCSALPSVTVRKLCSSLAYPKLPEAVKDTILVLIFRKKPRTEKISVLLSAACKIPGMLLHEGCNMWTSCAYRLKGTCSFVKFTTYNITVWE